MTFSSRQPSLRCTVFTGGAALSVKIPFAGLISGRVFVIVQADNKTIGSGIVRAGRVPQAERGANPHEWVIKLHQKRCRCKKPRSFNDFWAFLHPFLEA